MANINESNVLILATNGFEQSELEVPRDKLSGQVGRVHVASLDGEPIKGWDENNWGREVSADLKVDDVNVDDYEALIIPGGQINPDILRTNDKAVSIVKEFFKQGKVIGAICHGPWMLIEAGIIDKRNVTSYHSIKTDMINAGADWHDKSVVCDKGIVTSRTPDDLEDFIEKIIEELKEGSHNRKAA